MSTHLLHLISVAGRVSVIIDKDKVLPLDQLLESKSVTLEQSQNGPAHRLVTVVLYAHGPDPDLVKGNGLENWQFGTFHVQAEVVNDRVAHGLDDGMERKALDSDVVDGVAGAKVGPELLDVGGLTEGGNATHVDGVDKGLLARDILDGQAGVESRHLSVLRQEFLPEQLESTILTHIGTCVNELCACTWKDLGLASIRRPVQLRLSSKSRLLLRCTPSKAPHSTKNPFSW